MEKQFIQCRPGKTLGHNKVLTEGIYIFTTSNNYGSVLHLLRMLPKNCISPYYQIIPKTVQRNMNKGLYNRLILLIQDEHGTYCMLTTDTNHDIRYNKLKEIQTCLMKVKDTNQSMIASF